MESSKLILPDILNSESRKRILYDYNTKWSKGKMHSFIEAYLFDVRMKKVWLDLKNRSDDSFIQGIIFYLPIHITELWFEADRRSLTSKKKSLSEMVKHLDKVLELLDVNKKIIIGMPEESSFNKRMKFLGANSNCSPPYYIDLYKRLETDISFLKNRCESLIEGNSDQYYLGKYMPKYPEHSGKKSAFRNFLIDEMFRYIDRNLEIEHSDLLNTIADIACVLTGVDTSYDNVRERIARLR